ncbi:hypothetical protein MSG_03159 [Mycobacterium shigaense]|uniref:Uncharacterized protein n=1 Tax=Mycobacterium shigaense TaxID=722731 RepID=A0A1Z4EK09_9MYCO|nr:hypothetical protein MSG_03159 [Mycobacterium shigaense]
MAAPPSAGCVVRQHDIGFVLDPVRCRPGCRMTPPDEDRHGGPDRHRDMGQQPNDRDVARELINDHVTCQNTDEYRENACEACRGTRPQCRAHHHHTECNRPRCGLVEQVVPGISVVVRQSDTQPKPLHYRQRNLRDTRAHQGPTRPGQLGWSLRHHSPDRKRTRARQIRPRPRQPAQTVRIRGHVVKPILALGTPEDVLVDSGRGHRFSFAIESCRQRFTG